MALSSSTLQPLTRSPLRGDFDTLGNGLQQIPPIAAVFTPEHFPGRLGERLQERRRGDVVVVIRVRDPAGKNFGGFSPQVARIDLIQGDIVGPAADRTLDINPTTRVVRSFTLVTHVRVRSTSGSEAEPQPDPLGEDPWSDLRFYANPIFISVG
jgi:hypothetical protein